jgi:hypothetical protein
MLSRVTQKTCKQQLLRKQQLRSQFIQKKWFATTQQTNNVNNSFTAENTGAKPQFEEEITHFGFKDVKANEKASMVGHVFSNVADKYDVMNDAMSAGKPKLRKRGC